ncbi:hypothetical protein [Actinokineospora globicatena]|uniref:Uncharacterized protein n=1 Tax=Actinokineospora globicatena TaxID=103729 RepID=A0A9W6V8P6_9PSEU|nr:hypothetical protein [Actinokineospora globicatena]MCP2304750.1 hypothetical protein [Actinokineospora globicatena]GLW77874.1 hypothetical protein Aglo01_23560 [Actinokineospora globicatena]GLW85458.1 hypothetical protein Aglo02_30980 [Actinokineospora globicatena]GLW94205.1 hypothetical protein Aglo03_50210 [Actinokineospora globicatena]
MFETTELEARVVKPHRVTAASLALIDGGAGVRAWDDRKGITAPAEFRLLERGRHRAPAAGLGQGRGEQCLRMAPVRAGADQRGPVRAG